MEKTNRKQRGEVGLAELKQLYILLATNELKNYSLLKKALRNLSAEKKEIESRMSSIKGWSEGTPVHGSGNSTEDRYVNCLDEIIMIEDSIAVTEAKINAIESALNGLGETDRVILKTCLVNENNKQYYVKVEELMARYHISERMVYYRRKQALEKYCMLRFGDIEGDDEEC